MGRFDADMLFVEVCHYLGIPESQMEPYTLVFNMTILNHHTCGSVISRGR